MATINGTPVNFGFTGSNGIAITGQTGALIQNAEHSKQGEREKVRNGVGDTITHGHYDIHDQVSLEYIITDPTNIAGAITNTTAALLTPGTIIVITACPSMPSLVATTWEVQSGAKISGSNTNAKRATIPLEKYTGITGAAS